MDSRTLAQTKKGASGLLGLREAHQTTSPWGQALWSAHRQSRGSPASALSVNAHSLTSLCSSAAVTAAHSSLNIVKESSAWLGPCLRMQRVGLQAIALHEVEAVPELPVRQRVALYGRAVLKHLVAQHETLSCIPHWDPHVPACHTLSKPRAAHQTSTEAMALQHAGCIPS